MFNIIVSIASNTTVMVLSYILISLLSVTSQRKNDMTTLFFSKSDIVLSLNRVLTKVP